MSGGNNTQCCLEGTYAQSAFKREKSYSADHRHVYGKGSMAMIQAAHCSNRMILCMHTVLHTMSLLLTGC